MYLTILLPCLNESETLEECINEIKLCTRGINHEILVVDNGSSDDSDKIALANGCRVVYESIMGYGSALITGIRESLGEYIIMLDCDCSYKLENINEFITLFNNGYDFICGNRFKGGICKGAMPLSHRLGVPILSKIAKLKYKVPINDFHCGLRGFKRGIFESTDFTSTGMEFATEIIALASKKANKICEVGIKLYKDKRSGSSHLSTVKDGFRHLGYILLH